MNRKKLFTVILTGITAFMLLVGCGSDADNNKEDSTSADIQSGAAGTDTEDSAKAEDTADTKNSGNAVGNGKTLVVYYSASGNTERVAGVIADAAGADIFKVEPTEPYSDDDLDWTDEDSRVSVEHENENEREVELVSTAVDNWDSYDTVFVGYPKSSKVNHFQRFAQKHYNMPAEGEGSKKQFFAFLFVSVRSPSQVR